MSLLCGDAMTEWRPIETAPRDGTPVLLYIPGENSWNRLDGTPDMVVGIWTNFSMETGWFSDCGDVDQGYESTGAYFVHDTHNPTHWMPLPSPPK